MFLKTKQMINNFLEWNQEVLKNVSKSVNNSWFRQFRQLQVSTDKKHIIHKIHYFPCSLILWVFKLHVCCSNWRGLRCLLQTLSWLCCIVFSICLIPFICLNVRIAKYYLPTSTNQPHYYLPSNKVTPVWIYEVRAHGFVWVFCKGNGGGWRRWMEYKPTSSC